MAVSKFGTDVIYKLTYVTNFYIRIFFFWQKIQSCRFLQIWAWNLSNRVFWYAESDGVIFIKILSLVGDVSPLFKKSSKFSQARSLWWVILNLIKFIYLESALYAHSFDTFIDIKIPFLKVSITIEPYRLFFFITYMLLRICYYVYEGVLPLVNTTLFTLKVKKNLIHKPLNHKGRLIRIDSSFESTKKNCSVKSEVLTWGRILSHTL